MIPMTDHKDFFQWIIACVATILTVFLNFQSGPSHDAVILSRAVFVSSGIVLLGLLMRSGIPMIISALKKYAILLFLSLFISIPYFIWYFLGQDQYGGMVLILGIINIDIVTVLQVISIIAIMFLLKKSLILKGRKQTKIS